jgi:peptide/nickel transport system substrate-binding protein
LRAGILAALVGAVAAHVQPQAWAQAATLRVGLNQDIDTLDPTLSQSYASRVVLTQLCERLYDLDANAVPVPQLAASLPESTDHGRTQVIRLRSDLRFSDGTAFDAHAVKLSLERHLTLRGSMRRTELGTLAAVEVVAPLTVRLRLDRPFAPLLMALADRAGMILSPAQLSRLGERFGTDPVCVGPWRFAEAVPGQRIVLERSPFYGSGSRSNIERIEFRPIPDSARRLAALHSGEVDVINAVPPLDIASLRGSPGFGVIQVLGPGYVGITINIANRSGRQAGASNLGTPWSQQPKVREALELSLDRAGLNRIALGGEYVPGCTPFSPAMPFHPKELKCALRDVLRAKRLLAEEGFPGGLSLGLTVVDDPVQLRVGQAIQAMARDAGIRVRLKPAPFREILDLQEWGRFEALLLGFAGRLDPDSVIYPFHTCRGTFNFSLSCDPALDLLLTEAQEQESTQAREKLYGEAVERLSQTRSIIYLYHQKYTLAYSRRIKGLVPSPDGLVRLAGVRLESVPTSTGVRSPSGRRGARRLSNL